MRFVRYQTSIDSARYGWVFENLVGPIEGTPFGEYRRMEAKLPLENVDLLAPIQPGKIIGVVQNYQDLSGKQTEASPQTPILFIKANSSVIGPGDHIIVPPQAMQIQQEAELAVVIGRTGRWISAEEAMAYIAGYTCANDVTATDILRRDGQWARGKSFDTFCPLGPWVETNLDPSDAMITCHVNHELRQMASTHEMLFTIPQLITYISSVMTLYPGDVILTGSPMGSALLQPGDIVNISIEGIGDLSNPVSSERLPAAIK